MILHLGVFDIPYADASYQPLTQKQAAKRFLGAAKKGSSHAKKKSFTSPKIAASQHKTTGDVATILEEKYHIMEIFFELHENQVVGMLEQSMEDALMSIHSGGPGYLDPNLAGTSELETEFKNFLSNRGMDQTATPGVPTKAALRGVSHRFLHPYAKRPSRPSFIDTGLYQANFHAWMEA